MKSLIVGCILILNGFLMSAQSMDATSGNTNVAAGNPNAANQAPDDVIKKLSDLIHTEKYPEAQKMTTGLLAAYPDDQRLIKAKTLLDKLLVSAKLKDVAPYSSQPAPIILPVQSKVEDTNDEVVGIGVQLDVDRESHQLIISTIFANSPASEAGLSAGFIINKIDGVPTEGKSLAEAYNLFHKGGIGTEVKLELVNSATKEVTTKELIIKKFQLPDDTSPAQLTGMEKVEYNSLIELGNEAQQATDLDQQKALLAQFINKSSPFLQRHPHEMLLWELYAATAITLNAPLAGYIAGQKLLSSGLADNDPIMQRLLSQLNLKGWLDRQIIEDYKNLRWILGKVNASWYFYGIGIPFNGKEEFSFSDSMIVGYEITGDGVKSLTPNLRGTILDPGNIKWEWYSESASKKKGQMFYPSGWQQVISFEKDYEKKSITIVVPSQSSDPNSKEPWEHPITLVFTKASD